MEEKCVELQEFVSGRLSPEYLSDIESSRLHWQGCERCQHSFPHAMEQLDAIVDESLSGIRQELQSLHGEFREKAKQIIDETKKSERAVRESEEVVRDENGVLMFSVSAPELSELEPKLHAQLIKALAKVGCRVQANLQFMNDFWGLDYFTVARYYHGGEYDSQVCAPFIASLPADIQLFVFEAVLAVDLGGFDSDVWETFPVEYRSAVYGMIEHAAPEFLRRYLAKELKSQTVQTNPTVLAANLDKQLSAIPDRIQEVGQRVEDFGDSLKAGQMEIIRRIDRQPKRAVDFEPRLVEVLGDKLYFRLDNGTQRDLQLAEYNFSNNPEPDDYFPSINCFYRAFEKEFRQRILQPIVRSLVDKGYVNYPSGGSEKPLLMNRTFNKMAALGQVLGLLDKDAVVREIVNGLGLHADEICRSSRELKRMRNMAVHDDLYRREDAARVRNMVLGENSILRLLFTET